MGDETGMKAINFGSSQALAKHVPKGETKKYNTPAPGAYTVDSKHKFKSSQTSRFGGTMCKVDRAATGLAAEGIRKKDDPGPAHYSKTRRSRRSRGGRSRRARLSRATTRRGAIAGTHDGPTHTLWPGKRDAGARAVRSAT